MPTTTTANDLRRTHPDLYRAPDTPVRITVPPLTYLMVDGAGDPRGAPAYADAVGALYAVSYGLRFMVKKAGGEPWTVMPLEGLWWAPDMAGFSMDHREDWLWTMLIAQPPIATAAMVHDAVAAAVRKGSVPAAAGLRLEVLDEGDAVQVMHHGPYADEAPTIAALHAFIADAGLVRRGKHHEVYLGDPRRTAPEAMRTILRQPVSAG
ncbi:MAG: GyrI-like domain-containing protein [Actinomycetales bacterium]|nr:GyrI-like domain-containing protein [Actinomycetales bacterium]